MARDQHRLRWLVTKLRLKPPSDGPVSPVGEPSLLGGRGAAATKTASKAETCCICNDIGFRRCLVAGYVAFILLTIPVAPRLWLTLSHATGLELEPLARSILLVAASVASMPAIIRPGLRSLLGLALVGILYVVVCLLPFEAPSERLHLLEYGLLPALVAWAMPGGRTVAARLGAGVLVAAGLGLIDEMTQGFTPGRVAQLQDVVVNAASGVAGALTAWILMPQGRPLRSHAGQ